MAQTKYNSQSLIPIYQIKKGVIILKDGSLRSIVEVAGVNIDLKSPEEQNILFNSWRAILNTLEFSLQVVILSYRLNINPYLTFLKNQIDRESIELLKIQGEDYYNFLTSLVTQNSIMKKRFFLAVPFTPLTFTPTKAAGQLSASFKNMFNFSREAFSQVSPISDQEFERAYQQLIIRQTNLAGNLNKMGLSCRVLDTKEIIELLYNLYNPELLENEALVFE
ncbi:MAG: hypothetical protein PHD96_01795 [Candidatus Pacebacteria bacterium]|jgi:type IV secretory pathway VirB4 component|nr:hypothetical protein [Candidatus Paceibacterota bacterium]